MGDRTEAHETDEKPEQVKALERDDASPYLEQLVAWRRHLHQYPEASFEEVETVAYIREQLTDFVPEAKLENLTPTSLVAVLETGRPGPKIGLRADIDGLVMDEGRPDLDFASKNPGRMHGCGHDGHTATMMSALRWAKDHLEELTGTVVAIFQHAEETPPGGAVEMVETGYFDDFDFIFGFHYWATLDTGVIDVKSGPASANSDLWKMNFKGVGAHASTPEDSVDAVAAAAQVLQQSQGIVARSVSGLDPVVVTGTWFSAGDENSLNVIPPLARIGGVVRTQDDETRDVAERRLGELAKGAEVANPGLNVELDYLRGYDMVWNDPHRTELIRGLVESRYSGQVVSERPMLGGEDFAAFSRRVPAVYLFIGAGNAAKGFSAGHHNPKFGLDEDAFEIGLQVSIDVLRAGPSLA